MPPNTEGVSFFLPFNPITKLQTLLVEYKRFELLTF
jgi:hypothetical protein